MSVANMNDHRLPATVAQYRDTAATPASIAGGHLDMSVHTEMTHETRA
jgi:hypothetical protein